MRGVVSAGMVTALNELGMTTAFDAVYGASAGSLNAAYFLAGQAALGTTIYSEDINNRLFINLLRPLAGRPILDLDYLVDDVMVRRKPLDTTRVLAAPTPLSIIATDVVTAERMVFANFTGAADLRGALRAGATMPIVAGKPFRYRRADCFDASLTEPIPVATAERAGHSHVLVLLTRPAQSGWHASAFDRWFVAPRLARISPTLAARFLDRGGPYAQILASIDAGIGPLGIAQVTGIRPAPPAIGKLERNRAVLIDGAARGRRAVLAAFAIAGSESSGSGDDDRGSVPYARRPHDRRG